MCFFLFSDDQMKYVKCAWTHQQELKPMVMQKQKQEQKQTEKIK